MNHEKSTCSCAGKNGEGNQKEDNQSGTAAEKKVPRIRPKKEVGSVLWSRRHGETKTPIYGIWRNMRYRCNNPSAHEYRNYGGRGIRVCERWNDFELFKADMGPRPSDRHSIDRINNSGNYEPSNCRWALPIIQNGNCRTNVVIEGETISQIARRIGVSWTCIAKRIKHGHDLYSPPKKEGNRARAKMNEQSVSDMREEYEEMGRPRGGVAALAKKYGIYIATASNIINRNTWKHIP